MWGVDWTSTLHFLMQMLSRVGVGDDFADSFLVESFETAVALEIFQVGTDGALSAKLVGLFVRDQLCLKQPGDAFGIDGPALAFGEGLAEVGKIGEGFHSLDIAGFFELIAKGVEIELAFQMVHAGLENRLAVQGAPEADGA